MTYSHIYRRESREWETPSSNPQIRYWRAEAKKIFAKYPQIDIVEIASRKSSSKYVGLRGSKNPPANVYVIIPSTGGTWGRSRVNYCPRINDKYTNQFAGVK